MKKRLLTLTLAFAPLWVLAQNVITGHIRDARSGDDLIGASVVVKNEKGVGVVTDYEGKFSLKTSKDAPLTLRVEFIGYRPLDVDVYDFDEPVEIALADNASKIDEVVVVGYGVQKRLELTSSITTVDTNILSQNNSSVESALQGSVAGLNVTTTSGQPGAANVIRIRGGNSITGGNEPLYVIDGFIVYNDISTNNTGSIGSDTSLDPLSFINPADIESVEVLKDVSATAIYGTRGANGVIIITTKKGSRGKNTINYNASFGWSTASKKLDFLNAWEWTDLWNELADQGLAKYRLDEPTASYDWQDEALRTAFSQEHQISFIGGDEKSRYTISGSYKGQNGILRGTDLTRYVGRVNYERDVFDNLRVGVNANGAYNKVTGLTPANFSESSVATQFQPTSWLAIAAHTPYTSIYNEDGSFNYAPNPTTQDIYDGRASNPISDLVDYSTETENVRVLATGFAEWTVLKNLKLKAVLGADLSNTRQSHYAPSYTSNGLPNNGFASVGNAKTYVWQTEYTANYSNIFNKVHSLNALFGYTAQHTDYSPFATTVKGFSNDATGADALGAANTTLPSSSYHSISTLQSWIGRVNYSYDSRYNASLTLRADGSSRFAKDHRWGWFPSLGASWNIDREKWIHFGKDVDFIQLRASVGTVGNQEIGDYQFVSNIVPKTTIVNDKWTTGYIIDNKSNPDLKWETTTSYNLGLSTGFFKNRLTATLDVYYKKTSDLLLNVPEEEVSGFQTSLRNVGSVTNKGIEFELGGVLFENKDWRWTANANIAHNKNEVTSLGDAQSFQPSHGYTNPLIVKVGEPLGSFYGYKFKGIIQSDEDLDKLPTQTIVRVEPGNPKFEDIHEDGVIDQQDRTILGSIQPDFTYGFNTKVTYKNWDFFLSASGSHGNEVFNETALRLERPNALYYNPLKVALDRWTPEHPSNSVQKATNDISVFTDDRYVEDASYLKIRNIQLGYTLPVPQITKDAKVRLYVSLQNFFTITNYSGYDPEATRSGESETSSLYQGIDFGTYPSAKTVLVGFNITL